VVSGDRFIPYFGKAVLGEYQGAYLDLLDYQITEESRSVDGRISQSESFSLDLLLINRGNENLEPDTLVLSCRHPSVFMLDSLVILKGLDAGDTLSLSGIFQIVSGTDLIDQEAVVMNLSGSGDTTGFAFNLKEKIVAPVLESRGITWDDRALGNGNGIADAGEWLVCKWDILNAGHLASGELKISDSGTGSSFILLNPGEQKTLSFQLQVEAEWVGFWSTGPLEARDGYNFLTDSFYVYPGQHLEDFSYGRKDRFAFVNSLSSTWQMDNQNFFSPPYALRSGLLGDQEQSEIGISFEIPERDTLTFSFRVSSEAAYDFLVFRVDSVPVHRWSGEQDWSYYAHVLEPGRHVISWAYEKDESIAMGEDAAWIDDLGFPSRAFSKQDLSLTGILGPVSGPWLSASEQFSVKVKNSGTDALSKFTAGLVLEGKELCTDTLAVTLVPGQEMQLPLTGYADLSARQTYDVLAWISGPGDDFQGNNRIYAQIIHYDYPDLSLNLDRIEEREGIRMDALVSLQNEGNMQIDSFCYELWINDSLQDTGCRFIGLNAGEETTTTFRLADSTRAEIKDGFFDYLLRSVVPDSVSGNNVLTGRRYWQVLGTETAELRKNMELYPNPASQGVNLHFSEPVSERQIIHLLDSGGRMLASFVLPAGKDHLYIPLHTLSPGSYLLKLEKSGITLPFLRAR